MTNSRGFNLITQKELPNNGFYIRINVTDKLTSLQNIFKSLIDLSWIDSFFSNDEWLKESMQERSLITIRKISEDFDHGQNPSIKKETGEKMISEISRRTLIEDFDYWAMPIAELFKQKADGNPGFDFHTMIIEDEVLMFGEAKYITGYTAYNSAMNQIGTFIDQRKDIRDLAEVAYFMPNSNPLNKAVNNIKGYVAAFSTNGQSDEYIIPKVIHHRNYNKLSQYYRFIAIAIDI